MYTVKFDDGEEKLFDSGNQDDMEGFEHHPDDERPVDSSLSAAHYFLCTLGANAPALKCPWQECDMRQGNNFVGLKAGIERGQFRGAKKLSTFLWSVANSTDMNPPPGWQAAVIRRFGREEAAAEAGHGVLSDGQQHEGEAARPNAESDLRQECRIRHPEEESMQKQDILGRNQQRKDSAGARAWSA